MDSVMQQFSDWLKGTIKETLNKLLDKAQKEEKHGFIYYLLQLSDDYIRANITIYRQAN